MSAWKRLAVLISSVTLVACSSDPVSQPEVQGIPPSNALLGVLNAHDQHGSHHVAILDDCDSTDPAWNATGGCALRNGVVDEAEFGAMLQSPLSAAAIGHPAWRNEPQYVRINAGKAVRVTNQGGRTHTFTPVADFGGGRVPPLNVGLTLAPECALAVGAADPWLVPAGGRLELDGLAAGNHRFQCCFHPWMRAVIKVE